MSEYKNPFQNPEEEYLFLLEEHRRLLSLKEEYRKRGIKNYLNLLKQISKVEDRLFELEKLIGKERVNEIINLIIQNRLNQKFEV